MSDYSREWRETAAREISDLRSLLAASVAECVALRRELAAYRERDAQEAIARHTEDKAKLNRLAWSDGEIADFVDQASELQRGMLKKS